MDSAKASNITRMVVRVDVELDNLDKMAKVIFDANKNMSLDQVPLTGRGIHITGLERWKKEKSAGGIMEEKENLKRKLSLLESLSADENEEPEKKRKITNDKEVLIDQEREKLENLEAVDFDEETIREIVGLYIDLCSEIDDNIRAKINKKDLIQHSDWILGYTTRVLDGYWSYDVLKGILPLGVRAFRDLKDACQDLENHIKWLVYFQEMLAEEAQKRVTALKTVARIECADLVLSEEEREGKLYEAKAQIFGVREQTSIQTTFAKRYEHMPWKNGINERPKYLISKDTVDEKYIRDWVMKTESEEEIKKMIEDETNEAPARVFSRRQDVNEALDHFYYGKLKDLLN